MSRSGILVRCLASTGVQVEALCGARDTREELDIALESQENGHESYDESLGATENVDNAKKPKAAPSETSELEESEVVDLDASFTSDSENGSSSSDSSCMTGNQRASDRSHVSCIQEAKLSPDGSCIFTTDYDRAFSVYPVVADLPEGTKTRALAPYARFSSPDPIWAFAANPHFDLNDASTTTVLVGCRDQYISLHNALWDISRGYSTVDPPPRPEEPINIATKIASYKLVDHLTEVVHAPLSLEYTHNGAYFFAGHQNTVSMFNVNHTNDPTVRIPTIPAARNKLKGGGRGFKGVITALSLSPPSSMSHYGILAAGARTRYVGLYDGVSGQEITHFALPGTLYGKKIVEPALQDLIGDGVSQVRWSPDGRYLYVAERSSNALLIYDIRNFSLTLGHCTGRQAFGMQKLGFDIWSAGQRFGNSSHEVWAGGSDGKVRIWRDPAAKEGPIEADEVIETGGDPIVASLVHSSGSVVVVAKGTRNFGGGSEEAGSRRGKVRGGGAYPKFMEYGRLDILGLGSSDRLESVKQ